MLFFWLKNFSQTVAALNAQQKYDVPAADNLLIDKLQSNNIYKLISWYFRFWNYS